MAVTKIEGVVNDHLRYQYDVLADVLYLRLVDTLHAEVYSDEEDDGRHLLRVDGDDRLAGLTILGFWQRFGTGRPPARSAALEPRLERAARGFWDRVAAA